jgi:hypothetical protein
MNRFQPRAMSDRREEPLMPVFCSGAVEHRRLATAGRKTSET